jgi:hypothetical protein
MNVTGKSVFNGDSQTGKVGRPKSYRSDATSPTTSSCDGESTASSMSAELSALLEATTFSPETQSNITNPDDASSSASVSRGVRDAYEKLELSRLRSERRKKQLKVEKLQQLKEAKRQNHSPLPAVDRDTSQSACKTATVKNPSRSSSLVIHPTHPEGEFGDPSHQDQDPDTGIEVDDAIQVGFAVLRALKVAGGGPEEQGSVKCRDKKEVLLNHLHRIISADETVVDNVQAPSSSIQLDSSSSEGDIRTSLRNVISSNISKTKPASSTSLASSDNAPAKPRRTNSNDDLGLSMNLIVPLESKGQSSSPESPTEKEGSTHTLGAMSMPSLIDIESVCSPPLIEKKKASNWNLLTEGRPSTSQKRSSSPGVLKMRQSKRSEEKDTSKREKSTSQPKISGTKSLETKSDRRQQIKKKSNSQESVLVANAHSSMRALYTTTSPRRQRPQMVKAQSERYVNVDGSKNSQKYNQSTFEELNVLTELSMRSEATMCSTIVSEGDNNEVVNNSPTKHVSLNRKLSASVRKGKRPGNCETTIATSSGSSSPPQSEYTAKLTSGRKSPRASISHRSHTQSTSNRSATPNSMTSRASSRSRTSHATHSTERQRSSRSPKRSLSAGPGVECRRERSTTDRPTTPTSKRSATRDLRRDRSTTPTGTRSSTPLNGRDRSRSRSRTPGTRPSTSRSSSGTTKKPRSQSNIIISDAPDQYVVDIGDHITQTPGRRRMPSKHMKLWKSLRTMTDSSQPDSLRQLLCLTSHDPQPISPRHSSMDGSARLNQLLSEMDVSELTPPTVPSLDNMMTRSKSPAKLNPSRKDTKAYHRDGVVESKQPLTTHSTTESSKGIVLPVPGRSSVDAFLSAMDWQDNKLNNSHRSPSGPVMDGWQDKKFNSSNRSLSGPVNNKKFNSSDRSLSSQLKKSSMKKDTTAK